MNGLPSSPIGKVSREPQFHRSICSDTDAPPVMEVFLCRLTETVKPRTERFLANPRKLEKARHGPGCILNTEVVSPRKFKIIRKVQVTISKHHFNTYMSPASLQHLGEVSNLMGCQDKSTLFSWSFVKALAWKLGCPQIWC